MTKEFLLHKGKKRKPTAQSSTFGFCRHTSNSEKPKELALSHRTQTEW
jgi:hypothetical protein